MKRRAGLLRASGLIGLIGISALLLSGCWDRLELKDRVVILAMAIEQEQGAGNGASTAEMKPQSSPAPPQQKLKITLQIAVPGRIPLGPGAQSESGGGGAGPGGKPVWVVSVSGNSIDDALMTLQRQVTSQLFFGHLQIIVIDEALARKGFENITDYLRRNSEIRRTAWMIVSKDKAGKLMRLKPELDRIPTIYMLDMMNHMVDMNRFPEDFIGLFWSLSAHKGQMAYLPYVKIEPDHSVKLAGMAYFRNRRMVDWIPPEEIELFLEITGKKTGGSTITSPIQGIPGLVTLHIFHRKSKITTDIRGGLPHVKVQVLVEGTVGEKFQEPFKIRDSGQLREIEQTMKKTMTKQMLKLIRKTQRDKADIFGFGEYVRAKNAGYWNRHIDTEKKWTNTYPHIQVDIELKVKIRRVGLKAK